MKNGFKLIFAALACTLARSRVFSIGDSYAFDGSAVLIALKRQIFVLFASL